MKSFCDIFLKAAAGMIKIFRPAARLAESSFIENLAGSFVEELRTESFQVFVNSKDGEMGNIHIWSRD